MMFLLLNLLLPCLHAALMADWLALASYEISNERHQFNAPMLSFVTSVFDKWSEFEFYLPVTFDHGKFLAELSEAVEVDILVNLQDRRGHEDNFGDNMIIDDFDGIELSDIIPGEKPDSDWNLETAMKKYNDLDFMDGYRILSDLLSGTYESVYDAFVYRVHKVSDFPFIDTLEKSKVLYNALVSTYQSKIATILYLDQILNSDLHKFTDAFNAFNELAMSDKGKAAYLLIELLVSFDLKLPDFCDNDVMSFSRSSSINSDFTSSSSSFDLSRNGKCVHDVMKNYPTIDKAYMKRIKGLLFSVHLRCGLDYVNGTCDRFGILKSYNRNEVVPGDFPKIDGLSSSYEKLNFLNLYENEILNEVVLSLRSGHHQSTGQSGEGFFRNIRNIIAKWNKNPRKSFIHFPSESVFLEPLQRALKTDVVQNTETLWFTLYEILTNDDVVYFNNDAPKLHSVRNTYKQRIALLLFMNKLNIGKWNIARVQGFQTKEFILKSMNSPATSQNSVSLNNIENSFKAVLSKLNFHQFCDYKLLSVVNGRSCIQTVLRIIGGDTSNELIRKPNTFNDVYKYYHYLVLFVLSVYELFGGGIPEYAKFNKN